MNDFWEWRSSSQEFEGTHDSPNESKRRDSTRGGKLGLIAGVVLFVVLASVFVIFEYAK